jgi:ankyrin repeat protein
MEGERHLASGTRNSAAVVQQQGGLLLQAAACCNANAIEALLRQGEVADFIDFQENDGWTALMRAANNGHSEALKLLLDKGADPNLRNSAGQTALMLAAQRGHAHASDLLRAAAAQKGPDSGQQTWTERTWEDDNPERLGPGGGSP